MLKQRELSGCMARILWILQCVNGLHARACCLLVDGDDEDLAFQIKSQCAFIAAAGSRGRLRLWTYQGMSFAAAALVLAAVLSTRAMSDRSFSTGSGFLAHMPPLL